MITEEEIEAGRSPAGGWTRAQLAAWGVPWPPPKGWRDRLLAGETLTVDNESRMRPGVTAEDLLQQVVSAVVSAGHASDLYDFPDVLAFFGSQVPGSGDKLNSGKGKS